MNFSIARIFSYTRQLEALRAEDRERQADETQRLVEMFSEERQSLQGTVEELTNELGRERQERRFLQDRLCQKLGVAPIYEPSPGEALQITKSAESAANRTLGGPRAMAQAQSARIRETQMEAVKKDVAEYRKQHPDQQQAG